MFQDKKRPDASNRESSLLEDLKEVKPVEKVINQIKSFITRDRTPNDPFTAYLNFLDSAEKRGQREFEEESQRLYEMWAKYYNHLKKEFWLAWDLFKEIEDTVEGWHAEFPNLAKWGPVGLGTNGYTFGVCVNKNFKRNAPNPEKSLVVTYGISTLESGIGDERRLGRQTPIDDTLTGFEDFAGKTINEQFEGCRELVKLLQKNKLSFRITHKDLGHKTADLDLTDIEKNNLYKICQALFVGLNRDVMPDFDEPLRVGSTTLLLK